MWLLLQADEDDTEEEDDDKEAGMGECGWAHMECSIPGAGNGRGAVKSFQKLSFKELMCAQILRAGPSFIFIAVIKWSSFKRSNA